MTRARGHRLQGAREHKGSWSHVRDSVMEVTTLVLWPGATRSSSGYQAQDEVGVYLQLGARCEGGHGVTRDAETGAAVRAT